MSKDTCLVRNRGAVHVAYRIPEEGIRRSFAPGETKEISVVELEKLTYQPGGLVLLSQYLQILEQSTIAKFGMRVEPEYHMSDTDVAKLLKVGSLDAFLDALDFAPASVIELIKKLSIDLPLMDIQKRKALKEKTGFDVDAALRHIEEEKEDENGTILKQTTERRVKPAEPVSAGRRTAAPKYNIITPKADSNEQ